MAFSFLQSILQMAKLAYLSQGRKGGLETALVRTAPQGCPEADRGDGVCRSFVVPASVGQEEEEFLLRGWGVLHLLEALPRWNVPMFPAFVASKTAIA